MGRKEGIPETKSKGMEKVILNCPLGSRTREDCGQTGYVIDQFLGRAGVTLKFCPHGCIAIGQKIKTWYEWHGHKCHFVQRIKDEDQVLIVYKFWDDVISEWQYDIDDESEIKDYVEKGKWIS